MHISTWNICISFHSINSPLLEYQMRLLMRATLNEQLAQKNNIEKCVSHSPGRRMSFLSGGSSLMAVFHQCFTSPIDTLCFEGKNVPEKEKWWIGLDIDKVCSRLTWSWVRHNFICFNTLAALLLAHDVGTWWFGKIVTFDLHRACLVCSCSMHLCSYAT